MKRPTVSQRIDRPQAVRPLKLRKPAAVFRLIQRRVKGRMKSPYWQVRVRLARGKYAQKSSQSTHRAAAREFALAWIKQDSPQLCAVLGIKPLERPRLESTPRCVTTRGRRLLRAQTAA